MVEQARQAEDRGDLEEAEMLLARACRACPDDADLLRRRARLLLAQGDIEGAIQRLRRVVDQSPDDSDAFVDLARVLAQAGRLDEAQHAVAAALRASPAHVPALLMHAELAERQGRGDEAIDAWHRVLARNRGHVEARLRLASLHLEAGRPERAAPLLRAAAHAARASADEKAIAWFLLARLYSREGRWDETVEALAAVIEHRPDAGAEDWYRLAYARMQAGDREQAAHDLALALAEDSRHAGALALAETAGSPPNLRGAALPAVVPAGHTSPKSIDATRLEGGVGGE